MSTVNLYDVLCVSPDCDRKELKEAHKKLVLKYHPDRKGGDPEMFELVNHAYNVLINPKTREEFDTLFSITKQATRKHHDLREQSKNFLTAQENDITKKKSKEEQQAEFEKIMNEMDKKHNFNRHDKKPIEAKDAKRRMEDLLAARDQMDIENLHDKLFEDGRFDPGLFNRLWDETHGGHNEMIPHSGQPHAWNADADFSSFNTIDCFDNLYIEDGEQHLGTELYSSTKIDHKKKKKLTKKDVAKLKPADYTTGHNYKEDNYDDIIKQRLAEREAESKKYDERDMEEFDTDPNCGGFGVFSGLGIKNVNTISWNNEEDIQSAYNRLLEMRKNA